MENINNILNELRELAPTLSQVRHKNPFHVPPNHFEELAVSVMLAVKDAANDDELETPILDRLREKDPFLISNEHFAAMHDNLMDKVQDAELHLKPPEEAGFSVPKGYFETLHASIMDKVADHADINEQIQEILEADIGFTVPQSYFETLHASIMDKVADNAELSETVRETLEEEPAFTVPEGYFADLHNTIMQKVGEEMELEAEPTLSGEYENEPETPFIDAISQDSPLRVPQAYFANLHNAIMDKVQDADLETPQLDELSGEQPYSVPQGYFQRLKANLYQKLEETRRANQKGAKVVPMRSQQSGEQGGVRRLMRRLAVAASVLVVFFAGWQLSQNFDIKPDTNTNKSIIFPIDELVAGLGNDEILAYVNENLFDFADEMEDESFLNAIDTKELVQPSLELNLSDEEKNQLLEDLNIDDILMDIDADNLELDPDLLELLEQEGI